MKKFKALVAAVLIAFFVCSSYAVLFAQTSDQNTGKSKQTQTVTTPAQKTNCAGKCTTQNVNCKTTCPKCTCKGTTCICKDVKNSCKNTCPNCAAKGVKCTCKSTASTAKNVNSVSKSNCCSTNTSCTKNMQNCKANCQQKTVKTTK